MRFHHRGAPARRDSVQPRAAFTLVELLVVIAIIGVLLALLFPALKTARQRSLGVACLSNARQLQNLVVAYAREHRDIVVPNRELISTPNGQLHDSAWAGGMTWDEMLMTLLGYPAAPHWTTGCEKPFQCPKGPWSDRGADGTEYSATTPRNCMGHYCINTCYRGQEVIGATLDPNYAPAAWMGRYKKTASWQAPASVILFAEGWRMYGWANSWSSGRGGPHEAYYNAGYSWADINRVPYFEEKHLGRASIVFCDGHARQMRMIETVRGANPTYMNVYTGVGGFWTDDLTDNL